MGSLIRLILFTYQYRYIYVSTRLCKLQ